MRISDWSSDVCSSDRLGLAALLRADARVRAGGVDEGQQRKFEALGHLHQPQRLAVALGARHAEVAAHLGLGVAALLVADDHHAAAADAAQRSEEHTSELQSLMRISYAVFCLKKKTNNNNQQTSSV